MKDYFVFDSRRRPWGGFSRGFIALFVFLLIPSTALWFFYRWLFASDTMFLVPIFLAVMTAWVWAYLIGYGSGVHLDED